MIMKKMLCFALGMGIGVGVTYAYYNQNSFDQKVKCLKRKINKLEKQLGNNLKKLKWITT